MTKAEIISWLMETDEHRLSSLWTLADSIRREHVGDEVFLRGLIEISNICRRSCGYCGLRANNTKITRYRMTKEEILECAKLGVEFGYGTVVLQAGEDTGLSEDWISGVIRDIKSQTPLAVTLSLGERTVEELQAWKSAGADRYLLRFETSNRELYESIHPSLPGIVSDRISLLRTIKNLGYETGSGVMIGIPGQSYEDLANDILLFKELDLDMIGVGPFIPHPETPLGKESNPLPDSRGSFNEKSDREVPNTELMTYKVIALTRILCPKTNIPSTTALATLNLAEGRELGLQRGANIVMPNLTPIMYRALYEIYPAKACIRETPKDCHQCLKKRIESVGRTIGIGQGNSKNFNKIPQLQS